MSQDDDYFFGGFEEDTAEIGGELPEVGGDARAAAAELPVVTEPSERTSEDLPEIAGELTERIPEQTAADLPVIVEESVQPEPTEKSRKKTPKRARKDASTSGVEKSSLPGRRIHYSDVGFVDDRIACANVLYALKHPDDSASIPPLSELEESEMYAEYARSEMRNQALLNRMILRYQRKLKAARRSSRESDEMKGLNTRLNERRSQLEADLAARTKELAEAKRLIEQQSSELAEMKRVADRHQRSLVELNTLGKYSKEVKARADRLRRRLVYLDKVKAPLKKADQARSNLKCVQELSKRKISVTPRLLEGMEKDASEFEAEVKKLVPVELEEGELTPLGAYVPISDEFDEILGTEFPPERDEDVIMRDVIAEETPATIQTPAPARPNEDGGQAE